MVAHEDGNLSPWGRPQTTARDIANMLAQETNADPKYPTPEQEGVIQAGLDPLLVVAGAGSGKTETTAMRALYLIVAHGIDPETILGLTFSRKAAGELGHRLRTRLASLSVTIPELAGLGDPVSLTYHSFARQIILDYGMNIGIDPHQVMLTRAAAVQMMTQIVETWTGELDFTQSLNTIVKNALGLSGELAEHDLSVSRARVKMKEFDSFLDEYANGKPTSDLKTILATNKARQQLLDVIDVFNERKRGAQVLDYSDQMVLASRIVRESPDVVKELRSTYHAVFLDEFQDTSVVQMNLLSTIFSDQTVTAVGDPHQAIYSWRGASAGSLETFLGRFGCPHPTPEQIQTLSTSFRNDQQILAVSNHIAEPLRKKFSHKKLPALQARKNAGQGYVEIVYMQNRLEQVQRVADFIQQKRRLEYDRTLHRKKWTSTAVLCRQKRDFSLIDHELRSRGIPTQIIGLGGLIDQPAVSDVRAALELCIDVTQSPSALRLLMNLDLGSADLALLGKWARNKAKQGSSDPHPQVVLLDAVDDPPPVGWCPQKDGPAFTEEARRRVCLLGHKLRMIREGSGYGLVDQVERAISCLGVIQDIVSDPLINTGREAIDAFVDVAVQYESDSPSATLRGFLAWLAIAEEEENGLDVGAVDPDPDAVQIMTVHSSKGMEWNTVAVFALGDGVFPMRKGGKSVPHTDAPPGVNGWIKKPSALPDPLRADYDQLPDFSPIIPESSKSVTAGFNKWIQDTYREELGAQSEMEERRLAYVAFTRAEENLMLAGSWIDFSASLREPSRYLMEAQDKGHLGEDSLTDSGLVVDMQPVPDTEKINETLRRQDDILFPRIPGPSRHLIHDSARRVMETQSLMRNDGGGRNVGDYVDDPMLAHETTLLLRELRERESQHDLVMNIERLPATSVVNLLMSPEGFAMDMRRPLPRKPTASGALGSVFHAWVERQLRMTSGMLWDEGIVGEEQLTDGDREQLEVFKAHFAALPFLSHVQPVALEEPFTTTIADISVQGRIDAVFQKEDGSVMIVDWKTGHMPRNTDRQNTARHHLIQLLIYRRAWSMKTGIPENAIDAQMVYLKESKILGVSDLEEMLSDAPLNLEKSLGVAIR